jgi:hypothetical protein
VQFDPNNHSWTGRINPAMGGATNVTIIATVAPPTSQDLFQYYEKAGRKMLTVNPQEKTPFEPLDRLPPERKNVTMVQARRSEAGH